MKDSKKKAKKVTEKKVKVATTKRKLDKHFYEFKGSLVDPEDASKRVKEILKSQDTEVLICFQNVKEITIAYASVLLDAMFPPRDFRMKFLSRTPPKVRNIIIDTWKTKKSNYMRKLESSKEEHVLELIEPSVTIQYHKSRPSQLKGIKKVDGHKNSGEYTSTDYYVVDEILYIFVRAKDKDKENIWLSLPKEKYSEDFARHLFENKILSSLDKANEFVSNNILFFHTIHKQETA